MNRAPRIILYSHDTMGLGHMRRNLLLAEAFSASRTQPATLMVFGASEAQAWSLPSGTESLTLPAVHKDASGGYQSRSMAVSLSEVIAVRRQILAAAFQAFDPDLVLVDKVPGGLEGELEPALRILRRRGRAKLVLGLRDVLDDPARVRTEWIRDGSYRMAADSYDAIWVYGDPRLTDPAKEYGFGPNLTDKLHYTGYLDPSIRLNRQVASRATPRRVALCLVGGGQDGAALAHAFSQAPIPAGVTGVIVTGPHMPVADHAELERRAAARGDLEIRRFEPNLDGLLAGAEQVVAMGGYNTVMEILAHQRRALIVPRVVPRTEQLIRAERLAALGLIDVLHPDAATPMALGRWLTGGNAPRAAREVLDFGGLARVAFLAQALLSEPRTRRIRPTAPGLSVAKAS